MDNSLSNLEKFSQEHSYEEITDMETDFILALYEAVAGLVSRGEKVSLLRISKIVKVSPRELTDYLAEIVEMERQLGLPNE
tara:strand:+ start:578 stop:820 length:243 start_codon:yes stop_codon:yes gene_type:complete